MAVLGDQGSSNDEQVWSSIGMRTTLWYRAAVWDTATQFFEMDYPVRRVLIMVSGVSNVDFKRHVGGKCGA